MRTELLKGSLLPALMIASLILPVSHVAHAQLEPENFSVAPADFTVRDAPPVGVPYFVEQKLAIHNGADVERNFVLSVLAPPPENLEPGYEPIPDEGWIVLEPPFIEIEANSYKLVDILLDIPKWENLTGKRWEAWISVTRMAEPGELIEVELISRARIETTKELPPPPFPRLTSLIISEENFILQAGESKYLTATLTSDGSPVVDKLITWSVTAGTIAPSSSKTDTAGQVTVVYTAPSYETSIIVSASYVGSEQYESSSVNSYGTITEPSTGISMELVIGIPIVIGCAIIVAALYMRRRKPTEFQW